MKIIYKTAHFIIRQFEVDERTDFLNLFTDDRLINYLPKRNPGQLNEMFESLQTAYKVNPALGMWGAFAPNREFIGFAMLRADENNPGTGILGYTLHHKFWNRGLATFIAETLVNYGLNDLALTEIAAVTVPENIASQRVLEKAGFKKIREIEKDGVLLDEYKVVNKIADC